MERINAFLADGGGWSEQIRTPGQIINIWHAAASGQVESTEDPITIFAGGWIKAGAGKVFGMVGGVAAKTSTKLLNQFNSAESLIQGAGNLTKVKAGMQGFVKGDGSSIFKAITNGGTRQANGTILMQDGTTIFNHFSTKTGVYTIDINKAGQIFKIRVGQ